MKITGANFYSSTMDEIKRQHEVHEEQQLSNIPKSDSTAMSKSGGELDVGCLVSLSGVSRDGEVLPSSSDQESTTTKGGSTVGDDCEVTSVERSASESSCSSEDNTDDEDFLDILANSLDEEFDLEMVFDCD